jgi:hypothetical protein
MRFSALPCIVAIQRVFRQGAPLIATYATRDTERVYFEVMSEPAVSDP